MLYNVSYNRPKIQLAIDKEVGGMLRLRERLRMGGTGSPKLQITDKSIQIHNLMVLDNNANVCNIELREKGIIIRFRSLLETYALPIPYWKLTLYKGRAEEYSLYRDNYFIKIKADKKNIHKFMDKIREQKGKQCFEHVDDL